MSFTYEKRIQKCFFAFLLFIFSAAVLMLPSFAVSDLPDMSGAKAVYLYNIEQKRVMAEKDADAEVYPASTTKLMTGIVALDALSGRLDEQITVTAEMLKGVTGNNMGLKAGEQIVIRDVLYGMICGSANDAAAVLAHISAGSIEGFVALMNKKAIELGAIDTNYTNVSGMHDPAMVTTAYDTFLIAKAASENPVFVEMSSESKYQMPKTNLSGERNVYKKNLLISRYSETKYFNRFVKGLNSGSTTQGGYCLAAYAENEGQSYICIVLGAEERNGNICSYTVANALIDWAYSSYGYVEVLSKDRLVCEVAVELSDDVDYVTLRPIESLTVFLPLDTDIESGLKYSHKLTSTTLEAPVEEGQIAGFITVELDGEILGTVDLVTMNKVERSEFLYGMKRVRDFTTSRPFIISAVTFGLLITVYIFVTAFYRKDTQRRKRRRR